MMRGTLARYVGRLFLLRTLGAVIVFAALLQILDLFDAATSVLERGYGIVGMGHYVLLRLPSIVAQIVPLGVLIGALLTFASLARSNEIIVLRATGITLRRLLLQLAPAILLIGCLHLLLSDQIAPRAERAFARWWGTSLQESSDKPAKPIWFRTGRTMVSVERVAERGTRLEGVRIYARTGENLLDAYTKAEFAEWVDGRWFLRNAVYSAIDDGRATTAPAVDRAAWNVTLDPENLDRLRVQIAHVSAATALAVLSGAEIGARPLPFYRTQLGRKFATLLVPFVMVLLASSAAMPTGRDLRAGLRVLAAAAFGLSFLIGDGILRTLGESGVAQPVWAALGGSLLFGTAGVFALYQLEDGAVVGSQQDAAR